MNQTAPQHQRLSLQKQIEQLRSIPQHQLSAPQQKQLLSLQQLFDHRKQTAKLNIKLHAKELRCFFSVEEKIWFWVITGQTVADYLLNNPPFEKFSIIENGYRLNHIKSYVSICKVVGKEWRMFPPKKEIKIIDNLF